LEIADDEEQTAALTAACRDSSTDDELTSDCHTHSVSSCSAGVRDTLTADGSDVFAVPT